MIESIEFYIGIFDVEFFQDEIAKCQNDDDVKFAIINTTMTLFAQDVLEYSDKIRLIPSVEDMEQNDSNEAFEGNWLDRLMTLYVLEMHSNDTNETMYNYFVGAFPFIMMNDKSKFSSINES